MVIDGDNSPLFNCPVLYIGSAVPLEQAKGLEAIQQPLRERYLTGDEKSISGVDATIAVLPSEIQMTYSESSKTVVCFPISSLTFCAAVRCIHLIDRQGNKVPKFVSLNSPAAGGANVRNPAIFAAITRRTKGRKVLECHAFLCATSSDAKNLVQASKMADRTYRSGLGLAGFSSIYGVGNNSLGDTINSRANTEAEVHLIPADQRSVKSEVPQEFFDKPPPRGYFYNAGPNHVKSYTVERAVDGLPNGNLPNGTKTLERPTFRSIVSSQRSAVVPRPIHPQFIRHVAPMSMKKGGPILVNTLPPPKRFLSPPSHPMIARSGIRKDPYIYMQPRMPLYPPYAYRVPVRPPKDHSPSSCQSSRSGDSPKGQMSPTNSTKSNKGTAATNGNDASSSSDSSRPNSPPRDYEPYTAPDIQKSRLSRRDQHEIQKMGSMPMGMVRPVMFHPHMYPAYYLPHPMPARPRSLPPPMESKNSSKGWRKKKEKKSKKKTKEQPAEDTSSDHFGYTSEVPSGTELYMRSTIDKPRTFQNERAFAHSIVEETKRRPLPQTTTPYGHFDDKEAGFLY